MQHLDEGTIHAWLDGALSPDEASHVEQHAQQCAECAAMVADARGLIAGAARIVSALDIVPGGVIPKQNATARGGRTLWRSLRLSPFRAALAASLMIAAGSLLVLSGGGDKMTAPPAPVVAAAPAAPLATPAPLAAASETRQVKARPPSEAKDTRAKQNVVADMAAPATSNGLRDSSARVLAGAQNEKAKAASGFAAPAPIAAQAQQGQSQVQAQVAANAAAPAAPPQLTQARRADAADAFRPTLDSAAAKVSTLEQRREAPRPMSLAAGARGSVGGLGRAFEGCYQVAPDSVNWPRPLPARFELTATSVVRAIDAAGRTDTTTTWRAVSASSVTVTSAGDARQLFSLTQNAVTTTVQALTTTATRPVVAVRTSCPR